MILTGEEKEFVGVIIILVIIASIIIYDLYTKI